MARKRNALAAKRFEIAEKARNIASLDSIIHDLDALVDALSQQIVAEEKRTKIKDPARADYSMMAKAAAARRSKLIISLADLKSRLAAAQLEHLEATRALRDLEMALAGREEKANVAQTKHVDVSNR